MTKSAASKSSNMHYSPEPNATEYFYRTDLNFLLNVNFYHLWMSP